MYTLSLRSCIKILYLSFPIVCVSISSCVAIYFEKLHFAILEYSVSCGGRGCDTIMRLVVSKLIAALENSE